MRIAAAMRGKKRVLAQREGEARKVLMNDVFIFLLFTSIRGRNKLFFFFFGPLLSRLGQPRHATLLPWLPGQTLFNRFSWLSSLNE